ncbi:hypothetical protein HK097_007466 [Rhizophlyctis rosea]|uniref:SET domain-containing protein n=1 Tax=Rhizophlyctis rosea TaxID=64517 RepID=A0AAD5SJI1_9FUNG|nr:hypothetical protein HK097_007466 [Rhizophlyctis rosea]
MAALIHTSLGADASKVTLAAKDMIELLCRFACNSISVSDGELVNVGVGVFPTLSLMNHSCDPNCAIIFNGRTATLRSIKDIDEGEEICQSYLDLTERTSSRKKELRKRYFFDCRCSICEEEAQDVRSRYKCPKEDCDGWLNVGDDLKIKSATCTACGPIENTVLLELLDVIEEHRKTLIDVEQAINGDASTYDLASSTNPIHPLSLLTAPKPALHTLRKTFILQTSQLCHPTTTDLLRTRRLLLDALLSHQSFPQAYDMATEQMTALQQIFTLHHPAISVLALMRYKLAAWCWPEDVGRLRGLAKEAVELLEVSHGREQGLCREAVEALEGLSTMGGAG